MFRLQSITNGFNTGNSPTRLHTGLNLDFYGGELILMAGRNGSGKSTLLRILAGLETPPDGHVELNGRDLHRLDQPGMASAVSLMLAHPPDMPLTTCAEVVFTSRQRFISPWQWNLSEHRKAALQALETCGMRTFADRDFSRLSDGEKQKVMLARCLAQETPVLLLDEPLAFLDYPARRDMLDLLNRLCREQGKIIIYSSHDLELSLKHCHSLLLLQTEGKWTYRSGPELESLDPATLFEA